MAPVAAKPKLGWQGCCAIAPNNAPPPSDSAQRCPWHFGWRATTMCSIRKGTLSRGQWVDASLARMLPMRLHVQLLPRPANLQRKSSLVLAAELRIGGIGSATTQQRALAILTMAANAITGNTPAEMAVERGLPPSVCGSAAVAIWLPPQLWSLPFVAVVGPGT